ncbi:MAG: PKD domain-containing protein [Bacteroidia bacterium]
MNRRYLLLLLVPIILFLITPSEAYRAPEPERAPVPAPSDLSFVENIGQWPENVRFHARLRGGGLNLESDGLRYTFFKLPAIADGHGTSKMFGADVLGLKDTMIRGQVVKMTFEGANPQPTISGDQKLPEHHNYYIGDDPSKWASNVSLFSKVDYQSVYEGIDFRMYGDGDFAKYDFIVSPGADPALVRLKYEGAEDISIDKEGALHIKTTVRDLTELAPVVYQEIEGVFTSVEARFVLEGNTVSFAFPQGYNTGYELIIDPTLIFSTYTGSRDDNWGFTATYDNQGRMYGGGIIIGAAPGSSGFPDQPGAFLRTFQGGITDAVLARFNATGTAIEFATYLGGSADEQPHSLIVNDNGELYIYGRTSSGNFPTTPGAYDRTARGGYDIYITQLNNSGGLIASTRVGGSGDDGLNGTINIQQGSPLNPPPVTKFNYGDDARGEIILDSNGDVLLAACTKSSNFPTTVGAPQRSRQGQQDGVALRLSSNLRNLSWSTYIGGGGFEAAFGIKEDRNGNIFVTGGTTSNDFSTPGSPLNRNYQGGVADGFIAKYNNAGNSLLVATYIGTNRYDQSYFIEVDSANNVYITGQTLGNYPVVGNVYQNAGSPQFITKLDNNLSTIIYSTRFGQLNANKINISPTAFLVDRCENVYVAGWGGDVNNGARGEGFYNYGSVNSLAGTTSNMPIRDPLPGGGGTTDGSDFYIIVLERDARNLLFGSYMGSGSVPEHVDGGTSRFDPDGIIYHAVCAGCGGNSSFPTTAGVVGRTNGSNNCNLACFKVELDLAGIKAAFQPLDKDDDPLEFKGCAPLFVRFIDRSNNVQSTTTFEWDFGDGSSSILEDPTHVFTRPGTYDVIEIITDSTSCNISDTAYGTIIVFPPPEADAGPDQIICDGDSAMLRIQTSAFDPLVRWSPPVGMAGSGIGDSVLVFPPGDQEYIVSVTDTNGCQNRDTINVLIDQTLNVDVRLDTVICRGASSPLSGSTNGTSFTWTPANTLLDPSSLSTIATPDSTTFYKLSVESARGCKLEDSVRIEVYEVFTLEDTSLCRGDTILLATTNGVSFTWTPNDRINDTTLASPRIWPTNTTIYTVEARSDAGCFSQKNIEVIVNTRPNALVGLPDSACIGDTARISASGGVNYIWYPSDGVDNPFSANPGVSPDTTTVYNVIVIDDNFCRDTADVEVVIHPLPIITINPNDTICDGEIFFLQAGGAISYMWLPDTTLSALDVPDPIAQPVEPTTYFVVGTDRFGCMNDTNVTIDITQRPEVEIDGKNFLCVGGEIELTASGGDNVLWNTNQTDRTIGVVPVGPTTYYVTAFNGSCEGETDSITVDEFFDYPVANFDILPGKTGFAPQNTNFVNLSEGASNYFWDFGVNSATSEDRDPVFDFPYPQSYTISMIAFSSTGCSDTMVQNINLENVALHVPTGFTPNGDDINEEWYVGYYGIRSLQVEVYSRWGLLVYSSDNKDFRWDAMHKGEQVPEGVYVWLVSAIGENGLSIKKKGTVTVVR